MNDQELVPLESELLATRQRLSESLHSKITRMALCLCLGLLASGCIPIQETKPDIAAKLPPTPMFNLDYSQDAEVPFVMEPKKITADGSKQANFRTASASRRTRDMADWVIGSNDNLNKPFAIVDKVNAHVYVFSSDGKLDGAAPVLLGLGIGDEVAPGIADMPMGRIPPDKRTTPAGRFEVQIGHNANGKEILWVDYKNSISMHPVVTNNPKERRAERLASTTSADNRISFGCINVPVDFFKNVVHTNFADTTGVVYVMPETKSFSQSLLGMRD